jgi:hypothetical protein
VTDYYSIIDIENASRTGDDNNSPIENKSFLKMHCVTNNGSVGFAYYQKENSLYTMLTYIYPRWRI